MGNTNPSYRLQYVETTKIKAKQRYFSYTDNSFKKIKTEYNDNII